MGGISANAEKSSFVFSLKLNFLTLYAIAVNVRQKEL
jgi:hypothetical protein